MVVLFLPIYECECVRFINVSRASWAFISYRIKVGSLNDDKIRL